jgi:RimJ/RimL family protein N-acetyltransferase
VSLELHAVEEKHAELLLRWRNDDGTRRRSLSPEPVLWESHVDWLREKLADDDAVLFLGTLDGSAVGHVRVDRTTPRSGEISVVVAPEARGRGVGRELIATGSVEAARALELEKIVAIVKPDNVASLRAFEHAGYARAGRERRRGHLVQRLVWDAR